MTSLPILAEDVKTLKYITTVVSSLWPAPVSGAVHVGRRLNAQGNYEYRAIVTGYDKKRKSKGTLTQIHVAGTRLEVLLKLLEEVEDITETYLKKVETDLGRIKEAVKQEEVEDGQEEGQEDAAVLGGQAAARVKDWLADT